ncbi:MAG: hypothetical protein ACOH2H_15355 [Cypionkella sp.]
MAKKPTPTAPIAPTTEFRVVGPAKGRWRAGRMFGPEPTILTDIDMTEGQIDQLVADPGLVITVRDYVAPEVSAEPDTPAT